MYLNQFSVRVPEGTEKTSGYVEIEHSKQYTIVLRNSHSARCNAEVSIDGKDICTFRIAANSTMRLERKPDDDGRFTFYRLGSNEGQKADLENIAVSDLGLLKVVFTPETMPVTTYTYYPNPIWIEPYHPVWVQPDPYLTHSGTITYGQNSASTTYTANPHGGVACINVASCAVSDCAPGGTGLSGHSGQGLIDVDDMCLDYSQQTTIHLRLIEASRNDGPRPLRPVMNSSPIPPPVVRIEPDGIYFDGPGHIKFGDDGKIEAVGHELHLTGKLNIR